jgi:hypothetical protein
MRRCGGQNQGRVRDISAVKREPFFSQHVDSFFKKHSHDSHDSHDILELLELLELLEFLMVSENSHDSHDSHDLLEY